MSDSTAEFQDAITQVQVPPYYVISTTGLLPLLEARFNGLRTLFSFARIHPLESNSSVPDSKQLYPNIGEHSIATYLVALKVAELLRGRDLLSRDEFLEATLSTLLHDVTNPKEIETGGEFGSTLEPGMLKRFTSGLHERGLANWTDSCLLGVSAAGHSALPALIRRGDVGAMEVAPDQLVRKIIFLADACVASLPPDIHGNYRSEFCTPFERVRRSKLATRYPWITRRGCAFNGAGKFLDLDDTQHPPSGATVCGAYSEVVPGVAVMIAQEFAVLCGLGSAPMLFAHLADKLVAQQAAIRAA